MTKNKDRLKQIEKELKKLYTERSNLNEAIFQEEELPLLKAQVGKCFMYATGNEVVDIVEFDEEKGYKVVEYTLQVEKRKPIRFVRAVYWKSWYPFYDIKTASPLGHGYTEITARQYNDFADAAQEKSQEI